MQFCPTRIPGVTSIEIAPFTDERGTFARTFDAATFLAAGLPTYWPQSNISWNARRGTMRGVHYQAAPKPEPKLIRCTRGRIFDVAVDLRSDSRTFKQWVSVELSAERRNAVYIPAGCAHGFLTLEDGCEVIYQMGEVYDSALSRGIRWDDPTFMIDWPFRPAVISDRDAGFPDFAQTLE